MVASKPVFDDLSNFLYPEVKQAIKLLISLGSLFV